MTKTEALSEYERERLENIRQNQEMLRSLNLASGPMMQTAKVVHKGRTKPRTTRRGKENSKRPSDSEDEKPRHSDDDEGGDDDDNDSDYGAMGKTKRRSKTAVATRRSKRLRGENASEEVTEIEKAAVETGDFSDLLQTGEEKFGTTADAIKVTGHYSGWVEPGVMDRLGIRSNAAEAWESEGGGKFSFKDPLGTGKKVSKRMAGGQSVAKYVASKLLRKNPNSYFYRHTEPGVEQWTGDWTDEERQVFLDVARQFGCGDKWGLFSTYIPHRVGYQCSNYYRQYVIPAGWIIDDNYRLDSAGNAVYVGNHRRSAR
ncbi:hypothetical protein LPJ75_004157 [Coemansia sp. RSA 2598]|nr:hypothetical protein LPJ75_004157 [Coemansia sp. RSA 2598]